MFTILSRIDIFIDDATRFSVIIIQMHIDAMNRNSTCELIFYKRGCDWLKGPVNNLLKSPMSSFREIVFKRKPFFIVAESGLKTVIKF